jgi:hypothetical protein
MNKGKALSPFFSNIAVKYSLKKVQVNQDSLNINGIYLTLVWAASVNILGGSVQNVK